MIVKIKGVMIFMADENNESYSFFEPCQTKLTRQEVKDTFLQEGHLLLSVRPHTQELELSIEDVKQLLNKYEKED